MGNATRVVSILASAVAATACANETGIVLEISMSGELDEALEADGEDFESLRIWVGHTTDDPSFFRASAEAYYTAPRTRAGLTAPYRYLLEPTGELADIGPLVFAAAVGDDPEDTRLPFHIVGFDVSDAPMAFGDDEMRVVALTLVPPDGVETGIDDACIVWGMNGGDPSRIAPSDDLDCDGAIGGDDCDDLDPQQNNLDRDADGVSSCAGDCMDDPNPEVPWVDPARVHPGAEDLGENDLTRCDHIDEDCDGFCQAEALDPDGSGNTACGATQSSQGVCAFEPADCNEQQPGQQPLGERAGEACNGRDDGCDGFAMPRIPCLIADATECHWGQVTCDELEGEFVGENSQLHCKPLPDHFSEPLAPQILCGTTPNPGCLESSDPIACGFSLVAAARANCHVTSSLQCRPDRATLVFPGPVPPVDCRWHVVGGTEQAEWEVGFVDADAPPDAALEATSEECEPTFAVRARVPSPAARGVLLLVASRSDAQFGALPMAMFLDDEVTEQCTGTMACLSVPAPD